MNHWYAEETKNDYAVAEFNRIYNDEMTRVHWMSAGYEEFMHSWNREHLRFWEHVAEHVAEQICNGDEECFGHSMEVFHKEMALRGDIGRADLREFFLFVEGLIIPAAPKTTIVKCVQDPENRGYSYA